MIILCEEIGNHQIFIKKTLMYKLCILELAGEFPLESIFRKAYNFHKICMKEKHLLEIFFFPLPRSAQNLFHFCELLWLSEHLLQGVASASANIIYCAT